MNNKLNNVLDLIKKHQFSVAEKLCEGMFAEEKENFEFLNIYGYILYKIDKVNEAIKQWEHLLNINSDYFLAYNNLGNAFSKKKEYVKSIENFKKALKLNPNYFEAQYGLGNVYSKTWNFNDALLHLNNSIELRPNYLPALKSKVVLLRLMNKKKEALELLNELVQIDSGDPQIYFEKAETLASLGRTSEAIESYKNTYILDPNYPYVLGHLVYEKLNICEWKNIEDEIKEIKKGLIEKKKTCGPLEASTFFDSPEFQRITAKTWIKSIDLDKKKTEKKILKKKKIHIGYYSADFRDHAVGHLIAKMLESHDKSKFCIFGFYFGNKHSEKDIYHIRFKKIFDEFYDIRSLSDNKVRELSNSLSIDIAVDLMAHTGGEEGRLSIFSDRCAPFHVNFLGYPGTSGANFIDYIIADKVIIPEENKKFYSEKVIYLPNSYQPSEKNRNISTKKISKELLKLPEDKFIFCCFNSNQKILPEIYTSWANVLNKVPNSILWLLSGNKKSDQNLRIEAEKRGVHKSRILFAEKLPINEHLARIKFADLFLDTFPYNAHTSCSDSLWAGVPVLTKIGQSFPSRVAASLLITSNLKELITNTNQDYENKAVEIANDPDYLKNLKKKINDTRNTNPLFNSELFARNLEKIYSKIVN